MESTALVIPEDREAAELFVRVGAVAAGDVPALMSQATQFGRSFEDHVVQIGQASRADILHVEHLRGRSTQASRVAELPDYDTILNEPGQAVDAGSQRDVRVAIIASSRDPRKRFFVVLDPGVAKEHAQRAMTKVVHSGYKMAGFIGATSELLKLIYDRWDSRSERRASNLEDQSELQKEFDALGHAAFSMGASDIHISASRGAGAIHMRVHGELEHFRDLTEDHARRLCSAIYNTLAEADSKKEDFNPDKVQDAVIERTFPEGLIRFRYSGLNIAPSGFDITLRVIPIGVATKRKTPEQLGYSPDQCDMLDRMFSYSSGLILYAGTTGSGKSTSMANRLSWVAEQRPGKKIRTVEEPVEYAIDGAYQTPVKRIKGDKSDFLIVLRQIMRSDPDILGVGEIRDLDTAELAISGVRSGHMLVSTIHADGAPIIYDRLSGMGINRHDLASVGLVIGFVYQKLVQVLCSHCKVPAADVAHQGTHDALVGRIERVNGTLDGVYFRNHDPACKGCGGKGVTGRTVCAEILRPNNTRMLKAISAGDSAALWREWRGTINRDNPSDMTGRTAFEHALWKMGQGMVCPVSVEQEFHFLDEKSYDEALEE